MDGRHLGELAQEDPLLAYLRCHIGPQLGFTAPRPRYEVYRFSDYRDVYLYIQKQGGSRLVGKFFQGPDRNQARKRGESEFNNPFFLRESGLSGWPHLVARPFGFGHFLAYQGIYRHRGEVRERYHRLLEQQRHAGGERIAEFDAVQVWRDFCGSGLQHLSILGTQAGHRFLGVPADTTSPCAQRPEGLTSRYRRRLSDKTREIAP